VLEVANVNIGNVISDVFGVSGQAMVSVLVAGQKISIEEIADPSKARLRKRIPELTVGRTGSPNREESCALARAV
jgi:transposase